MRAMSCGLLVLFVLALSLFEQCNCEPKGYPLPETCSRRECPSYEVIESQKDFEIRSYKEAMWVSSPTINSSSYTQAVTRGFSFVFAYINGQNKQSIVMNMTAPALNIISPSPNSSNSNSSFVVNLLLPKLYQKSPPESDFLRPVKLPEQPYAAVRRFSGFMDDDNVPAELEALKKSLKGTAYEVATTAKSYSTAGYNSPRQQENRVNEVMLWFTKK